MDVLYKQLLELNKDYVPTNELISCVEEIKELSGKIGDCREKIKDLKSSHPPKTSVTAHLTQIQELETEKKEYFTLRDRLYKKLRRLGYNARDIRKEML